MRVGKNHLGRLSIQRSTLMLCALVLLLVTLWGNVPAFAHDKLRQAAQVSPLETPITATTSAIITNSLNAPTSPLPTELSPESSGEVTVGVTTGVTMEATTEAITGVTVGITSVITTGVHTATRPTTNTAPVSGAPTVTLVNRGQASLWLVGAVLVGLLVVIAVVIGRQR